MAGAVGLIAGFGFGVGWIEAGQGGAGLDFADDPGFELFLLGGFGDDFREEGGGDNDGAVVVGDEDVVGEDGDSAAGDGLLPSDEGEAGDGWGRGDTGAPGGQAGAEDSGEVADDSVGDEGGYFADAHAFAEDVAEDAGVGDAHGVDYGDGTGWHVFDGGASGDGRGPGGGRGEVFARGDEAEGEGGTDDALLSGTQGFGSAEPDFAQTLFEQDRGEGCGGDGGEDFDCVFV